MNLLKGSILTNLQRSTEGCERLLARHNRMTEHQLMGPCTSNIEGHVVANPIGADVVQSGINHPCGQRIDLNIAGAEVMPLRAGQGHVEWPLVEVMADLSFVGIAQGNAGHPGKNTTQLDLANPVEINPSRCQSPRLQHCEQIGILC